MRRVEVQPAEKPYGEHKTHFQLERDIMPEFIASTDYSIRNVKGYNKWWQKPLMIMDGNNNPLARFGRLRREKLYVIPCDRFDSACTVAIIVGLILSTIVWYYGRGLDLTQKYSFPDAIDNEYAKDDEEYLWLKHELEALDKPSDSDQIKAIRDAEKAINEVNRGIYNLIEAQSKNQTLIDLLYARSQLIASESFDLKQIQDIQDKIDEQAPMLTLIRTDPKSEKFIKSLAALKGSINMGRVDKQAYVNTIRQRMIALTDKVNSNNERREQLNTLNDVWTGRTYVWSRMALTGFVGAVTAWNMFKRTTVHQAGTGGKRRSAIKALRRGLRDTFITPPMNVINDTIYVLNRARTGLGSMTKQVVGSIIPIQVNPGPSKGVIEVKPYSDRERYPSSSLDG